MLDKSQELLTSGETDRGVKMLETIIEQYPKSQIINNAYLALGKYYISAHEQTKAIGYLNHLKTLGEGDKELGPPTRRCTSSPPT